MKITLWWGYAPFTFALSRLKKENMIRRFFTTLMSLAMVAMLSTAQTLGDIRTNARFLTDRMVYDLGVNVMKADALYEINYDFLTHIEPYLPELAYRDEYALNLYYTFLNERNDDLRWVLSEREYRRFMALEYYYRPLAVAQNRCYLSVYNIYSDRDLYYYDYPTIYYSYNGGHSRRYYHDDGYYQRYYRHRPSTVFAGSFRIGNVGVGISVSSDGYREHRHYNESRDYNYQRRPSSYSRVTYGENRYDDDYRYNRNTRRDNNYDYNNSNDYNNNRTYRGNNNRSYSSTENRENRSYNRSISISNDATRGQNIRTGNYNEEAQSKSIRSLGARRR